jgi:ankyrin repeat protein
MQDGQSLLYFSAYRGGLKYLPKTIEALLACDELDINLQNESTGETVLHYAITNGQVSLVTLLLEKGADPNIEDGFGETALDKCDEETSEEVR